ncbi:PD-(D/E)XK nuclease family protein [Sphingomonas aerolata]|uniref:PDDEXK-like family protein n=1 Tax=Sphingomonas aerolata TaxID=185951 RepID=UPI003349FC1B
MTVSTILQDIHTLIGKHRYEAKKVAVTTAPDFTPMTFLDTREKGLSRILAWLLDPCGSHAQGGVFLTAFLAWLGLDDDWLLHVETAKVLLEAPINANGRGGYIDVLIRMNGRMLAIENKPTAIDQHMQVERYLADLRSRKLAGHCLLYLSGTGNDPSAASIRPKMLDRETEQGTLEIRGYSDLVEWLDACAAVCQAPPVHIMLQGLVKYVRQEFEGLSDIEEATEIAAEVCGSATKLDAALSLFEAEALVRATVLRRLTNTIKEEVSNRRGWRILGSDLGPAKHSNLLIGLSPDATIGFGLQFAQANHRWLFFGITSLDNRTLPRGVKAAMQALVGSKTGDTSWPVWKRVGPNDRFFPLSQQTDREFWLAAHDGRLAKLIVDYVAEVERVLRDAKLLKAVQSRKAG